MGHVLGTKNSRVSIQEIWNLGEKLLRLIYQVSFDPKTTKQDFSPALSCTILF